MKKSIFIFIIRCRYCTNANTVAIETTTEQFDVSCSASVAAAAAAGRGAVATGWLLGDALQHRRNLIRTA